MTCGLPFARHAMLWAGSRVLRVRFIQRPPGSIYMYLNYKPVGNSIHVSDIRLGYYIWLLTNYGIDPYRLGVVCRSRDSRHDLEIRTFTFAWKTTKFFF